MSSKIQIDMDLFTDLVVYAYRHEEPNDMQYIRMMSQVNEKLQAMRRRELYTQYKAGSSSDDRKTARSAYLDLIGCFESFRWPDSMDVNVTRTFNPLINEKDSV